MKKKLLEDKLSLLSKEIENLYEIIKESKDIFIRKKVIESFYDKFLIDKNNTIGDFFYNIIKNDKVKGRYEGIVYTPEIISKYIIENTILEEEYLENPRMKVLDPCCGIGNITLPLIEHLHKIIENNLSKINLEHGLCLESEDIYEHIIKNNINCFEIDKLAIYILTIDIFRTTGVLIENICDEDFLFYNHYKGKYNIIIGNPPYIGSKFIDREYGLRLKEEFKDVYKDKSDISYCFIKKSIDILCNGGKIGFITSRYFLESISGRALRNYISASMNFYKIIDFYGVRPFKGVGIDPVIVFMIKEQEDRMLKVMKPNPCDTKGEEFNLAVFYRADKNKVDKKIQEFYIKNSELGDSNWIIGNLETINIVRTIEKKCSLSLEEICNSYQGIITGCDKAFILDEQRAIENNIERELLKPWIKSSYINKKSSSNINYIIYSNIIKDEKNYSNALTYIKKYKEKLENRRECKIGIRRWYELQWGRNTSIFEEEKIIFPYKCNKNKFIIDIGSYFSADIYALRLKEECKKNLDMNHEFLLYILNSKTYNFYFKTFAKKLGGDIYEYYPNTIMRLKIPNISYFCEFTEDELYKFFNFNNNEIDTIESSYII